MIVKMKNMFGKIFRFGGQKRRSKRMPIDLGVMYVVRANETISGRAKVVNVNKGGVCLVLDHIVAADTTILLKINPHAVFNHIDFERVQCDDRGRYVLKIVWVKEKHDGSGVFVGGIFLKPDNTPYK